MSFEVTAGDGTRFTVVTEGAGQPVIVLHPGSTDAGSWSRVTSRLAQRRRVLSFDRYTYRRVPPSGDGVMDAEVADVMAVAANLARPPVLVGHSSGGVVALEAARRHPGRFAALVLYEPPVSPSEPLGGEALRRARAALDAERPGRAVSIFLSEIIRAPAWLVVVLRAIRPIWRRLGTHVRAQIADTEAIEGLGVGHDRYRTIEVPALIVTGTLSPAHLGRWMEALERALPNAERVVIRRGGHGMHISAPGRLARTITRFLDGNAP